MTSQTNDDQVQRVQQGDSDISGHYEGDDFILRIKKMSSLADRMGAPRDDPMFPVVAVLLAASQKAGESCRDRREAKAMANRFAKNLKGNILANFEKRFLPADLVAKRSGR
jgi:hypothetical protein